MELRTPKGTVDYSPSESMCLDEIFEITTRVFKAHGAVKIETPVFELREILLNKFGDDEVLIYNLEDQGGDICSLRFDLTVSFARYLAQNNIMKMKRYQIGKVYRRDQPAITKGRFREFYQCDYDIAGNYLPMVADAEIIRTAVECMKGYDLGPFVLKISSKKLLKAFCVIACIPDDKFLTVCSSIDKLDKIGFAKLREELLEKGIDLEKTEILKDFILLKGDTGILNSEAVKKIESVEIGKEAIEDLTKLSSYLRVVGVLEYVEYDFSLARGATYYTGMIFEGIYKDSPTGSVVGGGRYDNLVDGLLKKNLSVPCVGFSVGILRIFTLMMKKKRYTEAEISVFVSSSKGLHIEERLTIVANLWDNNIPSETFYTKRVNFSEQKKYAIEKNIPIIVLTGEEEIKLEAVQILWKENKEMVKKNQMIERINEILEEISKNGQ